MTAFLGMEWSCLALFERCRTLDFITTSIRLSHLDALQMFLKS